MTNSHHLWYPKRYYRTETEKKFRGLPCHIVRLSVKAHDLLHAHQEPPKKPSVSDMQAAILRHERKECGCVEH